MISRQLRFLASGVCGVAGLLVVARDWRSTPPAAAPPSPIALHVTGGPRWPSPPLPRPALPMFQQRGDVLRLRSGVRVEVLLPGRGGSPRPGQYVRVHFRGTLPSGKPLGSSRESDPFEFRLGQGLVIDGWEESIPHMTRGGRYRVIIPPARAYGSQDVPGIIPPDATLIFDMTLVSISDKPTQDGR